MPTEHELAQRLELAQRELVLQKTVNARRSVDILGMVIDGLAQLCDQAEAGDPGAKALLNQWTAVTRRVSASESGLKLLRG